MEMRTPNYEELPFPVNKRQRRRIELDGEELSEHYDMYMSEPNICPRPEYTAGRGHDLVVWWGDGDRVAVSYVDVYGFGSLYLYDTSLVHRVDDEECECEWCAKKGVAAP